MSWAQLLAIFRMLSAASWIISNVHGQTLSISPQDSPTAVEGNSFQFTCTVSGSGSLSEGLYFLRGSSSSSSVSTCVLNSGTCSQFSNINGYTCVCVSGETRVFLMNITSVRRVDDENWRCQYSTFFSNTASLDVHYPPAITSVPSSKDMRNNTSPNIDCSSNIAPGNPSSTSYRWAGPGGYNKTGAVLDIPVTRTQVGEYNCTATNTAGLSDTATANINVQYPPTITSVPSGKDVRENTSPNIDCSSNITPGNPSLTSYRWTGPGDYSTTWAVLGRFVSRTQGGQYTCTATNTAGLSDTATVNINVQYPPTITSVPSSKDVREYTSPNIDCSSNITPGNPSLTSYRWTGPGGYSKPGAVLDRTVSRTQGGQHTCTATNTPILSDTATVSINVQYPPDKPTITNPGTLCEGQSTSLICSSSPDPGNPAATYYWTRNNVAVSTGGNYTFIPGRDDHQAEIRCAAGNNYTDTAGHSRPQSNIRQLDVYYILPITIIPASTQTRLEGDNLTLTCSADSNPDNAVLSWMFAGTTLPGSSLEKTNLKSTDQGEYRCTGTVNTGSVCPNGQLQGNKHVVVLVYSAPPVPEDLIAFSTDSHTVKLSWKVFVSGIKQQFLIEYKDDEDGLDWKMSKKLHNESGKEFVQGYVTDLKPGALYFFRVKAIAGIGSSNFSDVIRVFTMNLLQNSQETNTGNILIGVGIVMIILGIVVAAINIFLFVQQKRSQSKQKQEQYATFQSPDEITYDEIQRGPAVYQNTGTGVWY